MTTAHRPTFNPAKGGGAEYGYWSSGGAVSSAFSSLDLPAHTKLKFRQTGQATTSEVQQLDMRTELEEKEQKEVSKKVLAIADIAEQENKVNVPLLLANRPEIDEDKLANYDDKDQLNDNDFGSSDEDDSDDDDEDDEAEIQRELERIKREREEARKKEEEERLVAEEQAKQESAVQGNPLMNLGGATGSAKIKRRWNDDVIFRNQAKIEPGLKKRFVNDTIRNDFHKRFLDKYMK